MKPLVPALALLALGAACDRGIAFPDGGASWAAAPVPAWASMPRIAMTDNGDDTLAFVSRDTPLPARLGFLPIGDIPVELEGPHHLAASPDSRLLFVGLSNYVPGSGTGPHGSHGLGTVPGSLLKLDAKSGVKLAEAVVDRNPGDVILSKDGKTAYVSHYDLLRWQNQQANSLPVAQGYSAIAVVDTATMARPPLYPVCPTGHGMALSSDEKTLFVSCSMSDELGILDLTTHVATRVPVGVASGRPGTYFPYAVTRSPKDDTIWISCNQSGDVRVYDPRKGAMDDARTLFVNGVPMFSAFLSDGTTLLLPHQSDDVLSILDTSQTPTRELARVPLTEQACLNAHAAVASADDAWAYVVCEGDHTPKRKGSLVLVDLHARQVAGYVEVGVYPDSAVFLE